MISKPSSRSAGIASLRSASTTAAGGRSSRSRRSSTSSAPYGPNASMVTPDASFRTRPAIPSSCASRKTNGRKPTPWTVPVTMMRRPFTPAASPPQIRLEGGTRSVTGTPSASSSRMTPAGRRRGSPPAPRG